MRAIEIPATYEELTDAVAQPSQSTRPELYDLCESELKQRGYQFIDCGGWEKGDNSAYLVVIGWNSPTGSPVWVEFQDAAHFTLELGTVGIYDLSSFKTFLNVIEHINSEMAEIVLTYDEQSGSFNSAQS